MSVKCCFFYAFYLYNREHNKYHLLSINKCQLNLISFMHFILYSREHNKYHLLSINRSQLNVVSFMHFDMTWDGKRFSVRKVFTCYLAPFSIFNLILICYLALFWQYLNTYCAEKNDNHSEDMINIFVKNFTFSISLQNIDRIFRFTNNLYSKE